MTPEPRPLEQGLILAQETCGFCGEKDDEPKVIIRALRLPHFVVAHKEFCSQAFTDQIENER